MMPGVYKIFYFYLLVYNKKRNIDLFMPDISLLQQEYALPEEERRARVGGARRFYFLLIILGGIRAFIFYNAILANRAQNLIKAFSN